MGLLDFLTQGQNADGASYSDVPIGYRLGVLGNVLSAAAQGQAVNPNMFIGMAKMKEDAAAQRKQAKQLELASKYLDKRPDLKPLVESGAISIADIIKMDREDATKASDRKYEEEWWMRQEEYKRQNDPNRLWFESLTGGGGGAPAVSPGVESVTPTVPQSPAQEAAALEAQIAGVPTPPASGAPAMPPVPGTQANGPVHPITARLRDTLKDPLINDNEAAIIMQTVRNPDDLRSAYDTILKDRAERAKIELEKQKVAKSDQEAAAKAAEAKNSAQASQMTAIAAIDSALQSLQEPGLPAAGFFGSLFSNVEGTNAFKARADIEGLKAFISLDKLQNMRANSAGGSSGLGQVTNYEQRMLGQAQGAIEQGFSEGDLEDRLKVVRSRIVAFNTPSREDPNKSVLTVDSEKLAANPTPEAIASFEQKYGVGSSSIVTGDQTPATERPSSGEVPVDPENDAILQQYLPGVQ